jgi:tripartite-type tricarboxylate transporter receptor subunit TctC
MKIERRQLLRLAAGAGAIPAFSRIVTAQTYPSRPVRVLVGFPAGGTADIVARLIAQWLSERLGQQFIVENRPGANANIATEALVRASADGHTLGLTGIANVLNATLFDKLNFDVNRDVAMVAGLYTSPLVLELHPAVPAKTIPELISYAKSNPGKISVASFGNGSISHVAGELFKMITGVEMVHVPYRGDAPAITDLLGEQVQAHFGNLPASVDHIKTGSLRALAVTTAVRSEALPSIPTIGEYLSGYEVRLALAPQKARHPRSSISSITK